MQRTMTKRVGFTMDNIERCQCGACPVQSDSACVADKSQRMRSQMGPGAQGMPSAEDVPGLYCSSGGASCGDLDFSQQCLCPQGCEVYTENELSSFKYCQRGSADEVG